MIRLGLRLTLGAGREALARLVLIVLAGAVGCALLLLTLAGTHAVASQNDRYAWLNTGTGSQTISDSPDAPLWWNIRADTFRGRVVGIVEVAATRAGAPVPPGLPRLPGPGEYYASPALAAAPRRPTSSPTGTRGTWSG
jgi:hypothetical protein